jgi:Uma2 family endonuclease
MTLTLEPLAAKRWTTTEELLALPDDGVERELIDGELKEREMTRRNPTHSFVEANATSIVRNWSLSRPEPRGRVLSGEAGFRIRRNPDTTVGIDVAYIDAATVAAIVKGSALIEGPPVLAVEILSPSDKIEDILAKVESYLAAGTKIVWLLEPVFETVTVYRPDAPPMMLTGTQEVTAEPHLPGFKCVAKEFFI